MNNQIDIEAMVNYYENRDEHEKHLKGYMFDSLVFRYQLALQKAILYDHRDEHIRPENFKRIFNRELKRFMEILNEAIGEHD